MFDSPTTLYIYTSGLFARDDAAHSEDPLSARCSCGGLQVVSHIISSAHLIRLTEMEVVVLRVADGDQEANDVNEGCTGSVWCSHPISQAQGQRSRSLLSRRVHSRLADGFFPMYFFW